MHYRCRGRERGFGSSGTAPSCLWTSSCEGGVLLSPRIRCHGYVSSGQGHVDGMPEMAARLATRHRTEVTLEKRRRNFGNSWHGARNRAAAKACAVGHSLTGPRNRCPSTRQPSCQERIFVKWPSRPCISHLYACHSRRCAHLVPTVVCTGAGSEPLCSINVTSPRRSSEDLCLAEWKTRGTCPIPLYEPRFSRLL